MNKVRYIVPQPGFQTDFLSTPADIAVGGAGAGVGKTFALLLEALRHTNVPDFGAVIFRRTTPMIKNKGGLWDESANIFMSLGSPPEPVEGKHLYRFGAGSTIQFRHMEHEKNRFDWQGSQIPMIGFDELTHFTSDQFFYMLSRNRSTCGVKPYIRATTNPQSMGWVKDLLQWWIYPDDYHIQSLQGYPIPERAGVLRYMTTDKGVIVWGDSKEEVISKCPHIFNEEYLATLAESGVSADDLIKSVTFIPGNILDNKELLKKDPAYLGNLMAMDEHEKAKLLGGCWKMLEDEDQLYEYSALKDLFNNDFITYSGKRTDRYITADIALEGSDKFVIGVWHGWRLIKIVSIDKCSPDEVISVLKRLAKEYGVPQRNIVYDDDGAGSFVKGWLKNARPFQNGARAINKENYENLKTQCYYKLAAFVNSYEMYVADSSYRDEIIDELHATRKVLYEGHGKLRIISKSEIKNKLGGRSPDYADMIMMRILPEIDKKVVKSSTRTH